MMAPVQIDYNSYGHRCFGSCNGYDKYGEEYPVQFTRIQVFIECHKIDINAIQNDFNSHQHGDHITTGEESVHADEKQSGADKKDLRYGNFIHEKRADFVLYGLNSLSSFVSPDWFYFHGNYNTTNHRSE
jgi:hypothetical protein